MTDTELVCTDCLDGETSLNRKVNGLGRTREVKVEGATTRRSRVREPPLGRSDELALLLPNYVYEGVAIESRRQSQTRIAGGATKPPS